MVNVFALTSVTHSNESLLYVSYSWNFRHRPVRYYWYYTYLDCKPWLEHPSMWNEVRKSKVWTGGEKADNSAIFWTTIATHMGLYFCEGQNSLHDVTLASKNELRAFTEAVWRNPQVDVGFWGTRFLLHAWSNCSTMCVADIYVYSLTCKHPKVPWHKCRLIHTCVLHFWASSCHWSISTHTCNVWPSHCWTSMNDVAMFRVLLWHAVLGPPDPVVLWPKGGLVLWGEQSREKLEKNFDYAWRNAW